MKQLEYIEPWLLTTLPYKSGLNSVEDELHLIHVQKKSKNSETVKLLKFPDRHINYKGKFDCLSGPEIMKLS